MAFLMQKGDGKAVFLYTACADEDYCKAELLLLLARAPKDAKVLGDYDVDPSFSVQKFLQSYQGREAEIERMVEKVKQGGFAFAEVGIPRLTLGVDQPSPTPAEEAERIADLKATVEHYLPDFARGIQTIAAEEEKDAVMMIHQDAFAAGYHKDEYFLLGLAVKYAGLHGVGLRFHGTNHETF